MARENWKRNARDYFDVPLHYVRAIRDLLELIREGSSPDLKSAFKVLRTRGLDVASSPSREMDLMESLLGFRRVRWS